MDVCLEIITRKNLTTEAELISLLSTSPSATQSPILNGHILSVLSNGAGRNMSRYKSHQRSNTWDSALCRVSNTTGWLSRAGSGVRVLQVSRRTTAWTSGQSHPWTPLCYSPQNQPAHISRSTTLKTHSHKSKAYNTKHSVLEKNLSLTFFPYFKKEEKYTALNATDLEGHIQA